MNDWDERAIIRTWLGEGPERGRAEALEQALAATRAVRQRRRGWL